MIVNELGRTSKKVYVSHFKVLTQHLLGGTEENQDSQDSAQESNPPEYEVES
jgi:hypothetical protein